MSKLKHHGFHGIGKNWFVSYLEYHRQFVSIGNSKSNECVVLCGVPQGSVLALLLFLLYINDYVIVQKCSIFICLVAKNMLDLEHLVSRNIKNVTNWFNCNELSRNIDKTNFFIFHPPQKKVALKIKAIT